MRLREYETISIFKPFSSPETVEKLIQKIRPIIEGDGGVFLRSQIWGRKRLTYLIQKEREGLYVRLHFVMNPLRLPELEQILSYDESVLKFLSVKLGDTTPDIERLKVQKEAELPTVFRPEPEHRGDVRTH